jgi:hypothetical protein
MPEAYRRPLSSNVVNPKRDRMDERNGYGKIGVIGSVGVMDKPGEADVIDPTDSNDVMEFCSIPRIETFQTPFFDIKFRWPKL